MSSNKTANLQLNQWAATDNFLREEFNQDNSKIDAAVAAVTAAAAAVPIVKLAAVTQSVPTKTVEINLSTVDMSKYNELRVMWSIATQSCGCTLSLRVNHDSGAHYYDLHSDGVLNAQASALDTVRVGYADSEFGASSGGFFTLGRAWNKLVLHARYSAGKFNSLILGTITTCSLSDLQYITITTDYNLQPGSSFTVYGLKN